MAWSSDWPLTSDSKIKASQMNEIIDAVNERVGWRMSLTNNSASGYPLAHVPVGSQIVFSTYNAVRAMLLGIVNATTDYKFIKPVFSGVPTEYSWTTLQDDALGSGNTLDFVSTGQQITAKQMNDFRLVLNKAVHVKVAQSADNAATNDKFLGSIYSESPPGCPVDMDAYLDNAWATVAAETPVHTTSLVVEKRYRVTTAMGKCFDLEFPAVSTRHLDATHERLKFAEFPTGQGVTKRHFIPFIDAGNRNLSGTTAKAYQRNTDMAWGETGTNVYDITGAVDLINQWYTFTDSWPSGATASWYWKWSITDDFPYYDDVGGFQTLGYGIQVVELIFSPDWTQQ